MIFSKKFLSFIAVLITLLFAQNIYNKTQLSNINEVQLVFKNITFSNFLYIKKDKNLVYKTYHLLAMQAIISSGHKNNKIFNIDDLNTDEQNLLCKEYNDFTEKKYINFFNQTYPKYSYKKKNKQIEDKKDKQNLVRGLNKIKNICKNK